MLLLTLLALTTVFTLTTAGGVADCNTIQNCQLPSGSNCNIATESCPTCYYPNPSSNSDPFYPLCQQPSAITGVCSTEVPLTLHCPATCDSIKFCQMPNGDSCNVASGECPSCYYPNPNHGFDPYYPLCTNEVVTESSNEEGTTTTSTAACPAQLGVLNLAARCRSTRVVPEEGGVDSSTSNTVTTNPEFQSNNPKSDSDDTIITIVASTIIGLAAVIVFALMFVKVVIKTKQEEQSEAYDVSLNPGDFMFSPSDHRESGNTAAEYNECQSTTSAKGSDSIIVGFSSSSTIAELRPPSSIDNSTAARSTSEFTADEYKISEYTIYNNDEDIDGREEAVRWSEDTGTSVADSIESDVYLREDEMSLYSLPESVDSSIYSENSIEINGVRYSSVEV